MFTALNIAYEEPERRSLFHFYLSAFTFTLVGILGGLVMLIAIVYVPFLFAFVGFSSEFELLVRVGRWPFLALLVLVLLAVLYRLGPCRRSAKWRWVSVGSLFATTVWLLLASGAFSILRFQFRQLRQDLWVAGSRYHSVVLAIPLLLHHPTRR